jgi:recombinational DNA repair ATPase RecF
MTAVASPQAQLFDRLIAQGKDAEPWAYLVLAACDGEPGLARYLDDGVEPARPKKPAAKARGKAARDGEVPEAPRAYLEEIGVRGFRGIGPERALTLRPGPGLTLVIGRNGSGKSSFAEAIEVLLTGTSVRWSDKGSRFWKEGWRNLHDGVSPQVRSRLVVEGVGQVELARSWADGQDVEESTTQVSAVGARKLTDLATLGWESAVEDFRPFMSHSELASRFDEGPTVLYRALLKGLGLEAFEGIRECLARAQSARRKQKSEAKDLAKLLVEEVKRVQAATPDERLAETIALLSAKEFDLDRLGALATGTSADQASLIALLGLAAREKGPDVAIAAQTAEGLRFAAKAMRDLAQQEAGRAAELAALLQSALTLTDKTGDAACPVCDTPDVIDAAWRERTAAEVTRLRDAAKALQDAQRLQRELERGAQALCGAPPVWLADPRLDDAVAGRAREAWQAWRDGQRIEDADALAKHLDQRAAPLVEALAGLAAWAEREIAARQDVWQPIAQKLGPWVEAARAANRGQQQLADLKRAEDWVKQAIDELRNERFQPIAAKARENWALMRLQSNVDLTAIELEGTGKAQSVGLRVTVDGKPAGALGVMSQGELNSLALSLFLPRASLPVSPFGFVIVDDPVQAMDPARVEGLARVLDQTAKIRQVVVFTHDTRLFEAVKRLQIEAETWEVMRRGNSVIELKKRRESVDAYLEDARALMKNFEKGEIPEGIVLRVVPGLCRDAVEAACVEVVRRRRLKAGEAHADVEALVESAQTFNKLLALALFDDADRAGEVGKTIRNKWGVEGEEVYKGAQTGAHGQFEGDLERFVSRTGSFTGNVRKLERGL